MGPRCTHHLSARPRPTLRSRSSDNLLRRIHQPVAEFQPVKLALPLPARAPRTRSVRHVVVKTPARRRYPVPGTPMRWAVRWRATEPIWQTRSTVPRCRCRFKGRLPPLHAIRPLSACARLRDAAPENCRGGEARRPVPGAAQVVRDSIHQPARIDEINVVRFAAIGSVSRFVDSPRIIARDRPSSSRGTTATSICDDGRRGQSAPCRIRSSRLLPAALRSQTDRYAAAGRPADPSAPA